MGQSPWPESRSPPGVKMVRAGVLLCCENNPIIAAQHQIDVKTIHSSCEVTAVLSGHLSACPFFSLSEHAYRVSDKSCREDSEVQLLLIKPSVEICSFEQVVKQLNLF